MSAAVTSRSSRRAKPVDTRASMTAKGCTLCGGIASLKPRARCEIEAGADDDDTADAPSRPRARGQRRQPPWTRKPASIARVRAQAARAIQRGDRVGSPLASARRDAILLGRGSASRAGYSEVSAAFRVRTLWERPPPASRLKYLQPRRRRRASRAPVRSAAIRERDRGRHPRRRRASTCSESRSRCGGSSDSTSACGH